METNSRSAKMVGMALKKQDGKGKECQIKSTSTVNFVEMKSDSLSSSSFSEDDDDSVRDTTYIPPDIVSKSNSHCEPNSTSDSSEANTTGVETPMILTSPLKKGVNRKRNESNWVRNVNKKLRNSGKEYKMRSTCQKVRKERKIEPPCTEKCKRKCFEKFTEEERMVIFRSYWDLAMYEKQRLFIQNSMELIQSKYRYVREGGTRKKRENNNGFYFHLNGQKVRVCKLFFKNTLNINDRPIRTVQEKRNKVANVLLMEDCRGKQRKIDEIVREGVKSFIDKIPKIESHYARANTSKHFIDGSKSIADIHGDYVAECKDKNVPFVNYVMFYRIFTEDYNISFFTPKKTYEKHVVPTISLRVMKEINKKNIIISIS